MSTEWDGDTSDFDDFDNYVESALRPALEAETLACMKDGAARAKQAPFQDQSGDTRRSIEGGVGGSLAGGPVEAEFLEGNATGAKAIEGYIRAESEGAGFLEHGTKPHVIEPKARRTKGQAGAKTRRGRRMLRFEVGGEEVFARRVQHPGTSALKFIETSMTEDEFAIRIERTFERVLDARRPSNG